MPASSERAELVSELLGEVALTYHRLQAESGQLAGPGLSPGKLAILRTLSRDGPQTVAEIARSRPVSRQGVQRGADQLAREGLVEYAENPRHRRSRLLVITRRGERSCRRARQAQLAWVSWIDDDAVGLAGLRVAVRTLRWCRERLLETGS